MASSTPDLNYFTCTLGHATILKEQAGHPVASYKNVLELIEHQAKIRPQAPAIGFARFHDGGSNSSSTEADASPWPKWLTFAQLHESSIRASRILRSRISPRRNESGVHGNVIALLCPSSMDFILIWLGLMRLGYTVLFLA